MTKRNAEGFTLLELATSGFIAATLLFLSINLLSLIDTSRLNSATTLLLNSLHTARSSALQRQKHTILCANYNETCTSDWSQGLMIVIDENNNRQADTDDTIIYSIKFDSGILVKWKAFKNKKTLIFTPEGFTDSQNGRFHLCMAGSVKKGYRQIVVNKAGRARQASSSENQLTCQ